MKMIMLNIIIRYLRIINKVHKNKDKFIWRASETETYNHYDTYCFGTNFLPISLTLEEYNVSNFLPKYSEQANIPIFMGVTALKLDYGEVVILYFGQDLWFGKFMVR